MDQGLFKKYTIQIKKNIDIKEEICSLILEKTNIPIQIQEITILKKIITIHTTSTKRSLLIQKKVSELLQEKGYTVKL